MKTIKKGFWAGLLSFALAKVAHLTITGSIGLIIGLAFASNPDQLPWGLITFMDSPIIGIIFLIFATHFIYTKLTTPRTK